MFRSVLVFLLCISTCIASECRNGSLVLSLFGRKNSTGNWNLFYDFERNFCESTESWRLDLDQYKNSGKRVHLKGTYRERIAESEIEYATPIQNGGNERRTETIFITRETGTGADDDGTSVPEALIQTSAALKSLETFVTASSETDEAIISKSPNAQRKHADIVVKGGSLKRTEDGVLTNEVDEVSLQRIKAAETNLEEKPGESSESEDSGQKSTDETEMKIFSREDWKALDLKKEFETFHGPAKFIFVTQTNVVCPDDRICSEALRKMQRVLMDCFGDVYSNFYVDDGGRTYEGLGWRRMRSNDSIYVHFLTDGRRLPSAETFASFALLLWEGMRAQRVSEEYQLVENNHLTKSFQKELQRWVQWSKAMWVKR